MLYKFSKIDLVRLSALVHVAIIVQVCATPTMYKMKESVVRHWVKKGANNQTGHSVHAFEYSIY